MAKRISELAAAVAVANADEFEINQGGTSRKATRAQIVNGLASATHAHTLVDITDAGALAGKNTVGAGEIEADAVTTASIEDGAVTPAKLDQAYAEAGHGHADATIGAAGFISASDKSKLDGIEAGAQVNRALASQAQAEAGTNNTNVMTPLRTAQAIAAQAAPMSHQHTLADVTDAGALAAVDSVGSAQIDDGAVTPAKLDRAYAEAGHGHTDATTGAAGFMSAADKSKLDGIEAGAQANPALASQAEAEAGTNNTNVMSPLRTAQAISAQAAPASHQHTLADVTDAGALAALESVGTAQIDDDAVTLAKLAHGTADRLLGFNEAGAPTEFAAGTGISISGGTITATNGGGAGAPTGAAYLVLSNDVDLTNERALVVNGGLQGADGGANGSYTLSIAPGGVTNAKLADIAQARFKGRASAGSGSPEDLTAAQAWSILNAPATLTFGATVNWNVGAAPIAKLTLTGNCTINATSVPEGQTAVLILHQDATGGRSVTWGTGFSGVDPIHALGANGVSALYFGGTSAGLVMTQVLRASQAEAETGANHSRMMTPLRVKNAIDTFAAAKTHASSHVTGGGDKIRDATASQDGLMTAAYATKLDGIEAGATADPAAVEVPYDNTESGLTAEDVQAAIDELKAGIDAIEPGNGAGLTATDEKTAVHTAAAGELVLTDSSGGAFDVTLPAAPAHGAHIAVLDTARSWEDQPVTLLRNGATIDGFADDLLLDGGGRIDLIFNGEQDDWEIASVRGVSGITTGLHPVATSGDYSDLENKPTLGTAAAADMGDFATAAQGALAGTAVQPDGAEFASTHAGNQLTINPKFWVGSQADYDLIAVPDGNTIYLIVAEPQ